MGIAPIQQQSIIIIWRATTEGLIYDLYYKSYSTVTDLGQCPIHRLQKPLSEDYTFDRIMVPTWRIVLHALIN